MSQTRLSDFTFTLHFHALEKGMATHSSVLAWRITGTGESGGLPSLGSHRVGHDCSDLAATAAAASGLDVLWYCRVLESVLPLQRLRVSWPLARSRFHRWFVMALSEIKINTQKWEIKDGLHTNGRYKISQIIIKIIEYIHVRIHPQAKSTQSNKNKVE